ncbi:HEPN domain-containing protein [Skermanella aerolata]|uniref:HEPN domain-containing protein n=1 Tax=Skermanella aerolata TaxID=393310 RepID=UPI0011BF8AC6
MTMDKNFKKDLRKLSKSFLNAALAVRVKSRDDLLNIENKDNIFVFNGIFFNRTGQVENLLRVLVARAVKAVGPEAGSEKEIQDIAWKYAAADESQIKRVEAISEKLVEDISQLIGQLYDFVTSNHLIVFEEGVSSLEIGPVKAIPAKPFFDEFDKLPIDIKLKFEVDKKFYFEFSPEDYSLKVHDTLWSVKVEASRVNVEEEARWFIGVAISLLRLHMEEPMPLYPRIGEVEINPIDPPMNTYTGIKMRNQTFRFEDRGRTRVYIINEKSCAIASDPSFRNKVDIIFNAKPKRKASSVALRVAQGLGWLARGRQASDRSERLLHFFTAIEALLSRDDKNSLVVQTISRHASVILTNDIHERTKQSSKLKKLYTERSKLVHQGAHSVHQNDVDHTQFYAEALYRKVLEYADLEAQHDTFSKTLSECSEEELPWPSDN